MRAVRGKLPKKQEIHDWSEFKLFQLVKLAAWFTDPKTDRFVCTAEKIKEFYEMAPNEEHWLEFAARLNTVPFTKTFNVRSFQLRFASLIRTPLSWLKSNTHAISNEMREVMEKSKRLSWALEPFTVKATRIGANIVTTNNQETTDVIANVQTNTSNVTLPELQYQQSIAQLASIAVNLTKGIKQDDIKKMGVEARIRSANAIMNTLKQAMNNQPKTQVFKQLIINKAGKDELEKAYLDYAQEQ